MKRFSTQKISYDTEVETGIFKKKTILKTKERNESIDEVMLRARKWIDDQNITKYTITTVPIRSDFEMKYNIVEKNCVNDFYLFLNEIIVYVLY